MSLTGACHWTQQFNKSTGLPYASVRVFHYEPGTTTERTVWTDEAASSAAAQPVVGDSVGRVSFYGKGNYRLLIKSSVADGDTTLYDYDPVKLEDQPSGVRGELQDTSYPSATAANRGLMFFKKSVGGDITEIGVNLDATGFSALQFQSVAATATVSWAQGASLASAATLTLGADGNSFPVTGSVTITAISAKSAGTIILLRFASAISITHNATSLILRNGKNASLQAGDVLMLGSLGSGNWYEITRRSNDFMADPSIQDFRLSLTTAVPVTTSDVTAAGTVYAVPYKGNRVSLYNATLAQWITHYYNELSIAVPATTSKMHDVFIYDNAGTGTLELVAWTNDTTRATALVFQNGVYCKTGDLTRRYLGSFRTTAVANQTEDSVTKRYLWNYYHRVKRFMYVTDTTDSWAYSTATFRQANGAATNQLEFVIGVSEDTVRAQVHVTAEDSTAGNFYVVGIGLDSTSANSAQIFPEAENTVGSRMVYQTAIYEAAIAAGRHLLVWLEYSRTANTTTWFGDNGQTTSRVGIEGSLWG